MRLLFTALAAMALPLAPIGLQAASSTSKGQISVAQVLEMVTRAQSDPDARTTVIAYLAGVGEATGLLLSQAQQRGAEPLHCASSFNLDESVAVAALSAAAPDQAQWTETAATPIIVADMFSRAGCR